MAKIKDYGFTIVEILIVITVIGILGAIVTFSMTNVQKKVADDSVQADITRMTEAQRLYTYENGTFFASPGTSQNLFKPTSGNTITVSAGAGESGYCIKGYNARGSKNSETNAFTKESVAGACSMSPSPPSPSLATPTGLEIFAYQVFENGSENTIMALTWEPDASEGYWECEIIFESIPGWLRVQGDFEDPECSDDISDNEFNISMRVRKSSWDGTVKTPWTQADLDYMRPYQSAPLNLTCSKSGSTVNMSWSSVPGANSYETSLFNPSTNQWAVSGTPTGTTFGANVGSQASGKVRVKVRTDSNDRLVNSTKYSPECSF